VGAAGAEELLCPKVKDCVPICEEDDDVGTPKRFVADGFASLWRSIAAVSKVGAKSCVLPSISLRSCISPFRFLFVLSSSLSPVWGALEPPNEFCAKGLDIGGTVGDAEKSRDGIEGAEKLNPPPPPLIDPPKRLPDGVPFVMLVPNSPGLALPDVVAPKPPKEGWAGD
jgi:hypothetical protein